MKNTIRIFKSQKDLIIKLTSDNIINITGMMGSGKTFLSNEMAKKQICEVINLDWFFGYDIERRPKKVTDFIKKIECIYPETYNQEIYKFKENDSEHNSKITYNYYTFSPKIYNYIVNHYKFSSIIIEGRHIYEYIDKKELKGTLIIKRTSLYSSYIRVLKRDVIKYWKRYKNKVISKSELKNYLLLKLKLPINDYKKINRYIKKIKS